MTCPTCGSELDSTGNCAHCATRGVPAVPVSPATRPTPAGDPFLRDATEAPRNRWRAPLFTILAIILLVPVVGLNYLRALHWAGVINAESFGYMMGGVLASFLPGLLTMFLVEKARRKKTAPASKTLGVVSIALLFSMFRFTGEMASRRGGLETNANRQVGNLLKEAAGKQPTSKGANWWDVPTRDFFQDILQRN
jgi:hypothetical protein